MHAGGCAVPRACSCWSALRTLGSPLEWRALASSAMKWLQSSGSAA